MTTLGNRLQSFRAIARRSGIRPAYRASRNYVMHSVKSGVSVVRRPTRVTADVVEASARNFEPKPTFKRIEPSSVFQPPAKIIEGYSHFDRDDAASISQRSPGKLYYKGVPYSTYMDEWHFHPSRIGGDLAKLPRHSPHLSKIAEKIREYFVKLPNGGLALYYPKTFRVTRLRSTEYFYSGIAQAQLLAGYRRLARERRFPKPQTRAWNEVAHQLATSLRFPFERGGVCMDGKVILEVPNFRSPPEVVLNGWMDALLRLHDFISKLKRTGDWEGFFNENLAVLARILPQFDDEALRLSKYSNLSPYLMRLYLKNRIDPKRPPQVSLEYLSTSPSFSSWRIDRLWTAEGLSDCAYENKIVKYGRRYIDLAVSSSSLFDLRVHVDADAAVLVTHAGVYGVRAPAFGIPSRRMAFEPLEQMRAKGSTVFHVPCAKFLMTGQPTDFAKGQNFYHTYHVVALLELALMTEDRTARAILRDYALKWLDYIRSPDPRVRKDQRPFSDPAKVLTQVSKGRGQRSRRSFAALVELVRNDRGPR